MLTNSHNEMTAEELRLQYEYMARVKALLQSRYSRVPLAYTHSYGCQANTSDGERIRGMLAEMGYGFTEATAQADFILYNTCAIRKGAEDRIFGNVGELQHNKRARKEMIIALSGCMMQQKQTADKIKKSYPQVDLVFGTHALHQFPQMLYEALTKKQRVFYTDETENIIAEGLPVRREGGSKAWVQIMYGCDNFCTYCVVPYVRGRERSRRPEHILAEVRELAAQGVKEITLLGQNVNSYGKGLEEAVSFSQLLCMINEVEGDFRVRFMTSHPKDCTPELIDTIARCGKLCRHIHLPVQSGSDRVLALMNRRYTREQYLQLVRYARQKMPDITFTSDIIVGFPSETHDDLLETCRLIVEVEYDALFTFIYSKREGTRAAQMEDPVPDEEKSRWFREVQAAQSAVSARHNAALVGKTVRVLAEGPGRTGDGTLTGRTDSNAVVDFKAPAELVGSFVTVHITKALSWAVLGEAVAE